MFTTGNSNSKGQTINSTACATFQMMAEFVVSEAMEQVSVGPTGLDGKPKRVQASTKPVKDQQRQHRQQKEGKGKTHQSARKRHRQEMELAGSFDSNMTSQLEYSVKRSFAP